MDRFRNTHRGLAIFKVSSPFLFLVNGRDHRRGRNRKVEPFIFFFLARQLTPRLILENGGRDTRRHMSFRSFYVSGFYFYFNFFFCILERPQDPIRSLEFAHLFVCWKKKIIGKKHFHFIFADFFFFANEFRPSRDVPQLSELMESLFVFKE